MLSIIILFVIASVCGMVAQLITGHTIGGWLVSSAIGLVGAFIGGWLSRQLGIRDPLVLGGVPIVWTVVGSVIFIALLNMVSDRRR